MFCRVNVATSMGHLIILVIVGCPCLSFALVFDVVGLFLVFMGDQSIIFVFIEEKLDDCYWSIILTRHRYACLFTLV